MNLKNNSKIKMKMIWKVLRSYFIARVFNKPAPISTLINITNQCPRGCCYCDSWKQPPKHMQTKKLIKLLHEIRDVGVTRITFHGGDPLMHPDFGIIVREAKKCGFFITISVRETLIRKKINDLKFADLVFISFDGNQKSHDAQKGKGSFKDLIPSFQALKDNNIPFQTTTAITKLNKDDVEFITKIAKKYGFQAHFQPLQTPPYRNIDQSLLYNPKKNPLIPLIPSKNEYIKVAKKLLKLKKEGVNIATSKRIIKLLFIDWPNPALTYLPYKIDKSIKCWSGLLYNSIMVSGELYPCGYYTPTYIPGKTPNVFREGYSNALKKNIKDGSCKSCMIPCFMELNAMFSLKIDTILNWLPQIFRK